MRKLFHIVTVSLVIGVTVASCSLGSKDLPSQGGGTFTGSGGGGTTTGNAIVRFVSFTPPVLGGVTTTMRVSTQSIRMQTAAGTWLEAPLVRVNLVIHPTGRDLIDTVDLAIPAGSYVRAELHLSAVTVTNQHGVYSLTNPTTMSFDGDIDYVPATGMGLDPGNFARSVSTVNSQNTLEALWPTITGAIVTTNFGPYNHVMFTVSVPINVRDSIADFDAHCNEAAGSPMAQNVVPQNRLWKALASTSSVNAKDRFALRGDVYNANGSGLELLAPKATYWDPNNFWGARHDYSEMGIALGDRLVWTGTQGDGTADAQTCMSWSTTSGAEVGAMGRTMPFMPENRWDIGPSNCAVPGHLYCMDEGEI